MAGLTCTFQPLLALYKPEEMQASMLTSRVGCVDAPMRSRVRRSRAIVARAAAAPVTWGNRSCHNGAHLTKERKMELEKVCEHIAQRGKGITACDEGAQRLAH